MPKIDDFKLLEELSKYSQTPIFAMSGYEIDYKIYNNYLLKETWIIGYNRKDNTTNFMKTF